MEDKYLPIGTVVLLKGGTKKAMITGFCSVALEDKNKIYDYIGCVYPEGYLDFEQICLFDHNQIEKIFHLGYRSKEDDEFKIKLVETLNEITGSEEKIEELIEEIPKKEIELLEYL